MIDAIIRSALVMGRGLLFALLMLFRPLIYGLSVLVGALSMVAFLILLVFKREETTAIMAFLTTGVVSVIVGFAYNWVLCLLAPPGFTMLPDEAR